MHIGFKIAIILNLVLSGFLTAFVLRHMQDHDTHVQRLFEVQQSVERKKWLAENPSAPRQ